MLSNHILSTTLLYGFHVTVRDYTSFDMHDDMGMCIIYVATMPHVLDVSATLMIFITQKVIECPKLLGYSNTYSQIKGLLISLCQCDCTSVTSGEIICNSYTMARKDLPDIYPLA